MDAFSEPVVHAEYICGCSGALGSPKPRWVSLQLSPGHVSWWGRSLLPPHKELLLFLLALPYILALWASGKPPR